MRVAAAFVATLLAAAAAAEEVTLTATAPNGLVDQIPATVLKPDGTGPFAAVVILHDCSGLGPRSSGAPARWAKELLGRGYAVLMADSFRTRGFPEGVCRNAAPGRTDVGPGRRAADAYAALAYLRTLPYVDGRRIGVMGGSHGGSTTLASIAAAERADEPMANERRHGFAAAVALYPACGARYGTWRASPGGTAGIYTPVAPLLILIGEKDDWTPADKCRDLLTRVGGGPVGLTAYPGAYHSFDAVGTKP
ncbi:MAG TPA: dienelactone hydrolase family protein, partial [Thermoanaerobaculia bacterium]|nr:dienelactone hydrolase family protein [Thermoanaerobaculia bacterium]